MAPNGERNNERTDAVRTSSHARCRHRARAIAIELTTHGDDAITVESTTVNTANDASRRYGDATSEERSVDAGVSSSSNGLGAGASDGDDASEWASKRCLKRSLKSNGIEHSTQGGSKDEGRNVIQSVPLT
jgi:hypothetical protein